MIQYITLPIYLCIKTEGQFQVDIEDLKKEIEDTINKHNQLWINGEFITVTTESPNQGG